MRSIAVLDYSIFKKFGFERQPVGINFALKEPQGIRQLDKQLGVCEMFKEAQTSEPFYASVDNVQCGSQVMGMAGFPPVMASGQLGSEFSMFKTPAANRRVYDYVPVMPRDTVKYIIHSSLDKLTSDPDVLIITATAPQAEIFLRASSYSDGRMWNAKGSTCLACSWFYAYPYLTGQLNYGISGLGFSMKAREVLPSGLVIISIPGEMLPMMIANLQEIEWEPEWFRLGRDGFVQAVQDLEARIAKEFPPELVWDK
jgi:uncharacterized protein (DUF169 family)